jgi:NAD(P)H dehydrogenase (quinone)
MAEKIYEVFQKEGLETDLKTVMDIRAEELLQYDCIVLGSPTYYGTMAAEMKHLIDESVMFHGKLKGKVGGAFSTAANIGGGNETTILDILGAMLIHGMVIQGDPKGDHDGPVSIGAPDERSLKCCERLAQNLSALTKKLFG